MESRASPCRKVSLSSQDLEAEISELLTPFRLLNFVIYGKLRGLQKRLEQDCGKHR
jgi:hypothetical protein